MMYLNQKSTDQTESLWWWSDSFRWWSGNLGGGTPDTGSGPFRLNCIVAYAYTVRLWLGLSPPRLREEDRFALNASTTYRLRSTVLHTKVTRNSWRIGLGKRATAVRV